jgi:hypothetical protein
MWAPFLSCQLVDHPPSHRLFSSWPCDEARSLLPFPHRLTSITLPFSSSHGPFPIPPSIHRLPCVPLLPCIAFHHMSPSRHFSYTSSLLSAPSCFGPITPFPHPTFRSGLHAYSLNHSVIPGGSARSLPRPKDAELAGPSSISMKQLLKRLVVVRHRLRHNGKA